MLRIATGLVLALLLLPWCSSPAAAGFPEDATIAAHVTPVVTKGHCTTAKPTLQSSTIVTEVNPGSCDTGDRYTIWFFVCNGSESLGVAGMEFGIDYNALAGPGGGVDVDGTTLCADLEFSDLAWPAAGSGTIVTWETVNNCQDTPSEPFVPNTVIAIGMAMDVTVHSPDQLFINPRPVSGRAKIADCSGREYDVTEYADLPGRRRLGVVGFCSFGWQPCWIGVPVSSTTWGRLKLLGDS